MSGRRAKALRRAFFKLTGRAPKGAQVVRQLPPGKPSAGDTVKIAPSSWKRDTETAQRVITEIFVRRIFTVDVVEPSEWRRWKAKDRREKTGARRQETEEGRQKEYEGNTSRNDGAKETAPDRRVANKKRRAKNKCREYKRHIWKRYQTHSIGSFPILTGELRCTRCGADRNPGANGPVHHAEHEGPRYKTDRTAAKGFTKR